MEKIKSVIASARRAAASYGLDETELVKMEARRKELRSQTMEEQWMINVTLHYNNWQNLQRNEFEPIVNAFKGIEELITDAQCGGVLRLIPRGNNPESLSCPCGTLNWGLKLNPNP